MKAYGHGSRKKKKREYSLIEHKLNLGFTQFKMEHMLQYILENPTKK
jgi:hypothetical protein